MTTGTAGTGQWIRSTCNKEGAIRLVRRVKDLITDRDTRPGRVGRNLPGKRLGARVVDDGRDEASRRGRDTGRYARDGHGAGDTTARNRVRTDGDRLRA